MDLPRDPGPFGGRGQLGLLVPLPLQPPGPVLRGLEVGAPGAGVVAGEPGRRDQGGLGQERRRPLRFLDAAEVKVISTAQASSVTAASTTSRSGLYAATV